ncbi:MAG: pyridoxal-phosphate dependent enzyme [Desulfurellaceae bacterium]|nr:pyridoxal-phosphate dependent enzyme [Desulfurellaceae bacterium]
MRPSLTDIRAAADRIRRHIHRTPVLSCAGVDRIVGARLFFKCENFQKVGAFKIRGATNAVLSLNERAAAAGVATHSSGNHAAALALAARLRGVPAYVVMPDTAPQVKKEAVAGYGAQITFCAPTLEAREAGLARIVAETGAVFIPPYNDERIIAGQATAALELLADIPDLDLILTPVGGGGLVSGTALTVRSLSPPTRVIAAEPRGADDAYRSFRAGHIIPSVNPQTIADGLLTSLGDKTFAIIRDCVDDIVTVEEADIVRAMRLIWERMKIIVEPSAAVPLGALLGRSVGVRGKRVAIILSGGNVDLARLPFS